MVLFPGKCAGTAADDDNDEWIMFQLCADAKSQKVFLLQAGIGMVQVKLGFKKPGLSNATISKHLSLHKTKHI